ncbi:hypothetical protein P3S67_022026 [Capsicum chacoense]
MNIEEGESKAVAYYSTNFEGEVSYSASVWCKYSKFYGVVGSIRGSKSVNSAEKRIGDLMTRKSYANVEELKGLDSVARTAISSENRVGRTNRAAGRTLLGYRQL